MAVPDKRNCRHSATDGLQTCLICGADVAAALREEVRRLYSENYFKFRAADEMARITDDWVKRRIIDSRSALADARLDYGQPHRYEAKENERIVRLERVVEAARVLLRKGSGGQVPTSSKEVKELFEALHAVEHSKMEEAPSEGKVVERIPTCPGDGDLLLAIEKLLNGADAPTHKGDPVSSDRLSIVERVDWLVKQRFPTNNDMLGMLGVKEDLLCGLAEIESQLRKNNLWLDEGLVESVKNVIGKVVLSKKV